MKVAIIGSRELKIDITKYIPNEVTEIVSGGAKGIDAPLKRNETIVEISDLIVAIWNGESCGTKYVIDYAMKMGRSVEVHIISDSMCQV